MEANASQKRLVLDFGRPARKRYDANVSGVQLSQGTDLCANWAGAFDCEELFRDTRIILATVVSERFAPILAARGCWGLRASHEAFIFRGYRGIGTYGDIECV
jgi:hypothetical protein